MEEDLEDENLDCNIQIQASEEASDRKAKPPNKRKFDEEILILNSQIKEKDAELERLKSSGALHISKDLNSLRAEKSAKITRRKEIDEQLDRINSRVLPEKTLFRAVSQIKSREEKLKANASSARSALSQLNKAIYALKEKRRSVEASFDRQKLEYKEVKERQKQEGLQRKESFLQDKRKRIAEKEAAKVPFEEEIHLCNTLIAYLRRFNTLPVSESSADSQGDHLSIALAVGKYSSGAR
ncbi:DNA ligase 1-like [Elysia marginata]|uniref:DNA ligase 1-like n=1 Tax=Elysia marginata TaxID=1093978 RepID=A0AAV4IMV9_9GAST|nr:DNA ligase 1-like [Elysia marginata]